MENSIVVPVPDAPQPEVNVTIMNPPPPPQSEPTTSEIAELKAMLSQMVSRLDSMQSEMTELRGVQEQAAEMESPEEMLEQEPSEVTIVPVPSEDVHAENKADESEENAGQAKASRRPHPWL